MILLHMNYIKIVLCRTSHPGNIGASARAMKNMGLSQLTLVEPEDFPSSHANARASGAEDILTQARVVSCLEEAIQDCKLVIGTSARYRNLPQQLTTPREIAPTIVKLSQQQHPVALVFGHERNGLSNQELSLCQQHIHIPCNPDFSSLNLAAAVQLIAYECHMAADRPDLVPSQYTDYDAKATAAEMEGFFEHVEKTLLKIEFLDPQFPKKIMPKLRRLFNRAQLENTEMNILRGILTAINRKFGK